MVALIVAALVALGLHTQIANHVSLLICRIAGGDCAAQQAAVDKDCLVSSSTSKGGAAGDRRDREGGGGVDDDQAGLRRRAHGLHAGQERDGGRRADRGREGQGGRIGFDATASASAGGKLEGARTYTFTDPEQAREFEEQGARARLVRAGGARRGRGLRSVRRQGLGARPARSARTSIPRTCPSPTPCTSAPRHFIKGEAKAIGNVVIADAGAKGLLQYAGGARLYTAGPDAGKVELNLKIDAELAANLGLLTFGPEVTGKAQFIATVTLDKDHGYRPSHLRVVGTAGYNGDLGDADVALKPDRRASSSEIQDALEARQPRERRVRLDRRLRPAGRVHGATSTSNAAEAGRPRCALFSGSVPAAVAAGAGSSSASTSEGRLTFQVYDTTIVGHRGRAEGRAWAPASAPRCRPSATTRDARRARGCASPARAGPVRNCGLPE